MESQITLAFIQAYPNTELAQQLGLAEFTAFVRQYHYTRKGIAGCYARLQTERATPTQQTQQVFQDEAVLLARLLYELRQHETKERRALYRLFETHPDFAIFKSLPGTGPFLAPALCAKFGDDRQRFPDANSVQTLAGTCPATKSSGKGRRVYFRRACDREWRYLCQLWARALLIKDESPLAVAYFEKVHRRNPSANHAYRCLANRWLSVAWKLWYARTEYSPSDHFAQVQARSKPRN